MAELVEGHRDEGAGLIAGKDLLDLEFIDRLEAFILDELGSHRLFEFVGGVELGFCAWLRLRPGGGSSRGCEEALASGQDRKSERQAVTFFCYATR